jgi:hypothetical protein
VNRIASSKYDVTSYGAELLAGYNAKFMDRAFVTPMFGFGGIVSYPSISSVIAAGKAYTRCDSADAAGCKEP